MKILLTGGGSGGHITPLLAVAHELKKNPKNQIIYVGERNSRFAHLTKDVTVFDSTRAIFAGKFRRYHGESVAKKIFDVKTNLLNIRDAVYFVIGLFQSLLLVRKIMPDVVLLKGGFVGVPIGLACVVLKVPFITHDSDALPGLANRIVSRWARLHATGMPAEYYRYPKDMVRHVGVIVGQQYVYVDDTIKQKYKAEIGVDSNQQVLFITGGSNGASVINEAIAAGIVDVLEKNPDLVVFHQVGKGKLGVYKSIKHSRLHPSEFISKMHTYSGAADVIVTRAGANTIAEFGVQAKACIIIPNPLLTGGHQTKNGMVLEQSGAAIVLKESILTDPTILHDAIIVLLHDSHERIVLAKKLHEITVQDASATLAGLIHKVGSK